ncbi:MAG: hypothetical protein ACK5MQ_05370 [Pikeienuella sp.]
MRIALALAALAFPAMAAANDCDRAMSDGDYTLTGGFNRDEDGATLINLFPLFASNDQLAYAACPVVERGDEEITDCRIGILDRGYGILEKAESFALSGCAAEDGWSPACPDYTAEGFTAGNATRLSEALQRNKAEICSHFREGEVAALQSVPGRGEALAGLDGDYFYEIVEDCDQVRSGAEKDCAEVIAATTLPAVGVMDIRTNGRWLICAVSGEGDIEICKERALPR